LHERLEAYVPGSGPEVEMACAAGPYAERFVRSLNEERLDRIIPLGDGHFRRAVVEFVAHDHRKRNRQVSRTRSLTAFQRPAGRVRRQSRLGGLLNFYKRAA
jgi:hypothetical protein